MPRQQPREDRGGGARNENQQRNPRAKDGTGEEARSSSNAANGDDPGPGAGDRFVWQA